MKPFKPQFQFVKSVKVQIEPKQTIDPQTKSNRLQEPELELDRLNHWATILLFKSPLTMITFG